MSYSVSLVVPYRHDDWGYRENNWWFCWRWWNAFGPKDIEINVSDDPGASVFNRSRARNQAVEKSTGDILIIADADTLPTQVAITKAVDQVAKQKSPWVIPYEWYYNLSQEYSKSILDKEKVPRVDTDDEEFNYEHKIISWAGILVMPRVAYHAIGGYDERFEGWGFEDNAFRLKLDYEWGMHQRTEGNAYHLWHPIKKEDEFRYDNENVRKNRLLYVNEYEKKYGHKDERL